MDPVDGKKSPASETALTLRAVIRPADMDYLCDLLRRRAAISLGRDKSYLVELRLAPLLRLSGLRTLDELVDQLRQGPEGALHERVVDAMTTNETSFFRDGFPFEMLRQQVLPELLRNRSAERRLNFWSAACASGQEPYSLAMMLSEHFPQLAQWNVRILASDLSREMLARAGVGRYSELEISRGLPPLLRDRYFEPAGHEWVIKSELQRRVEFRWLNLIDNWPALPPMDVILLRNVLVYFDVPAKKQILQRIRGLLRPDGCLLLGGAETTLHVDPAYERVGWGGFSYYVVRR
jgi:chemotaxis protein methyltransferase CheR